MSLVSGLSLGPDCEKERKEETNPITKILKTLIGYSDAC